MKRALMVLGLALVVGLGMLSLGTATPGQFYGGVGTVQGKVIDAQGNAIANASVTIQTSEGLHPHATHTDASGHFEFARYSSGQYDLRAYWNGEFSEWDKRAVVRAKKTTEVTLRIPLTQTATK